MLIEYAEELVSVLVDKDREYPIAPDAIDLIDHINSWLEQNGYIEDDHGLEPPVYPRYD